MKCNQIIAKLKYVSTFANHIYDLRATEVQVLLEKPTVNKGKYFKCRVRTLSSSSKEGKHLIIDL